MTPSSLDPLSARPRGEFRPAACEFPDRLLRECRPERRLDVHESCAVPPGLGDEGGKIDLGAVKAPDEE
jgi:hypothetical protein